MTVFCGLGGARSGSAQERHNFSYASECLVNFQNLHHKDDHPEFAKSRLWPIVGLNFARAKVGALVTHASPALKSSAAFAENQGLYAETQMLQPKTDTTPKRR